MYRKTSSIRNRTSFKFSSIIRGFLEAKTRCAILRNTEISRAHLTPEIALRLLTLNCPFYHGPAPSSFPESDAATIQAFKEPFWSIYWPGGQALARFILDNGKELFSRYNGALNVLDLGAGCGATAIAAKLRGAKNVLANDTDPAACVAIRMNAALNKVRVETSSENLISRGYGCSPDFDLIFIGDLLYDEEIAGLLEPWLDQAVLRGAKIFVGDPGRHGLTEKLRKKMRILRIYPLPENVRRENIGFDSATVWQFSSESGE